MRKTVSIILAIMTALTVQAQSVIISEDVVIKNDFNYEVLGWPDGKVLLFQDKVISYEVVSFDPFMKKEWEKEISFEKKKINIVGFVQHEEKFSVIYSFRDKNNVNVVCRQYDPSANLLSSDTLYTLTNEYRPPRFFMATSKNRKKALVFEVEKNKEFHAFCIDLSTVEIEWVQTVKFQEPLRKDFSQLLLSNAGEAFIILDRDNQWTRRKNHHLEIFRFSGSANSAVKGKISLGGVLTYDLMCDYNEKKGNITGAATYTEKADNRTNGLIQFSISRTLNSQPVASAIPFDEGLLQDIYGKEVPQKRGIKDLVVRHIQPRNDGGVVVLCELSKEYSRRPSFPAMSSSYGSRRWVDYYFEEVVAYSIHPDGTLHWNSVLHKRQYSQDDDAIYSSFFVLELPAQLRVIFNDEIRNENTVSEYVLTATGQSERNSLLSTDYQKLKLKFREAVQISSNEIIVPSQLNNRVALVKIKYNDMSVN